MKIVINKEDLEAHVVDLLQKIPNNKLLLDHYLDGAIEWKLTRYVMERMFK
ncbi:MAG: hypothetical protein CM15mP122_4830 [Bacteroidota bacterium]|nr:MAG: hypothetical protein CM15mP122_4830 [Bacteroidota bacterium]